ncbi:MAG: LLM class flavin-dependent oxidoreductase [Ignavibacteriae bacterium]|nr:LLM class flavin-dependent oxidoreductase [Ignavibacteriota bacterium]MCB9214603.1 LLM class flavin-dependent oxidoreductase [Ignavibacteria bacterium]
MHLGLFSVADHYPNELSRTVGQLYTELLGQIELADRLGYESFWIAEHHFHEYGVIPRPAILLSAAAARTERIGLGSAVVVLPFDNPLRTAEDFAMVDTLSNGRLMLGVGSGYLKHEFEGFGVKPEEKRARFDEGLEILLKSWSGERFSFEGEAFSVENLQLNVLPHQRPHPPLWVAILSNGAAYHVGRRGLPIMMIPYATTESFEELAATTAEFRKGWQESGKDVAEATVRFGLHVHCAETTEKARDEAREMMDRYVRTRLYAKQRPFDLLIEQDLVAFGDPDEVLRVLRRYEEAGMTHAMAITNFGGMPDEKVKRSMELMAEGVLGKVEMQ